MFIWRTYVDKILYAVSFLRATPFIEKLEVHVSDVTFFLATVCYIFFNGFFVQYHPYI
jgi:hypothetical protein